MRWISQYVELSWLARGLRGDSGPCAMSADWSRLFPDADYRLAMNLRVIDGREFFATRNEAVLQQRCELLRTAAEFYRCGIPDTASLARFLSLPDQNLAERIEADWVLLRQNAAGQFLVEGGCVCFPTMWSLPEKIGLALDAVHAPVPALNSTLGTKIDQFLTRLNPDAAYGRENWGLSASSQLDQHPRYQLPEISRTVQLYEVWLRLEEQVLARLDDGQIVFGIRILNHRLDQLPFPARWLARALRTLSPEMAAYKRLAHCRERICLQLEALPDA